MQTHMVPRANSSKTAHNPPHLRAKAHQVLFCGPLQMHHQQRLKPERIVRQK